MERKRKTSSDGCIQQGFFICWREGGERRRAVETSAFDWATGTKEAIGWLGVGRMEEV